MRRGFTIGDLDAKAQRRRSDPPELKQEWPQKAGSLGLSGWRRFGVRVMLLRAKRRAKNVR